MKQSDEDKELKRMIKEKFPQLEIFDIYLDAIIHAHNTNSLQSWYEKYFNE